MARIDVAELQGHMVAPERDSIMLMFRQTDGGEGILTMPLPAALAVMRLLQGLRREAQEISPTAVLPEPQDELLACDAVQADPSGSAYLHLRTRLLGDIGMLVPDTQAKVLPAVVLAAANRSAGAGSS